MSRFRTRELEESGGYLNLDLPDSVEMDISVVHDVRNEGLGAGMGAQSPKHAAELKRYVDRYGCRDVVCGPPATSGRFCRKWALILPWVLDFWAVFRGRCPLSASPTWGNVGAARRFGLILPAKPPRSLQAISVIELGLLLRSAPINLRQLLPFDSQGLGARCEIVEVAVQRVSYLHVASF